MGRMIVLKSARDVQESVAYLLEFHHGNLEAAVENARESLATAHYPEDKAHFRLVLLEMEKGAEE